MVSSMKIAIVFVVSKKEGINDDRDDDDKNGMA